MNRVWISVLFLAACGTDDNVAKFANTWTFASGATLTATCDDGNDISQPMTGTAVYTKGTAADLTTTNGAGTGCTVLYDVNGNRATARPNQMCSMDSGDGTGDSIDAAIQSDVLALSDDGKTITETVSLTFEFDGDMPASCTGSSTWMMTKN